MEFRILGEFEALRHDDPIDLGSPRERALVLRLLLSPNKVVTIDRLMEDLWAGEPPTSARHALHVYVSRLRKTMGLDDTRLQHEGQGYCIRVEPDELDALRFEGLATEGRGALDRNDPDTAATVLRQALELWRGPALADVADETFARDEAGRLEELRRGAIEHRVWADLQLGRHRELVDELQEAVRQHPFRETLWEQLMLALYRSGRQTEALRAYQRIRSTLASEVGIEPGAALRRLEEQILAQDPSLEQSSPAPASTVSSHLPLQRTSFIGRVEELAQASKLLARCRLLTLTGSAGSGKTRLALRLASDHAEDFMHGIYFVPLAAISSPSRWARAVAQVLGLKEVPGEIALTTLQAFLGKRNALLVLDNFEQLLPAAPEVGALLDAAPGVTVLVTSRSPLELSGEQEFLVRPLEVPPLDELPDQKTLTSYDAVALFTARATGTDPSFTLNAQNAAAIAGITARLDGLPLAIELAAARIRALTPEQLLHRLDERLTVLTAGPADAEDRHRTMRDAIAWSYELLDIEDQSLFRSLGTFRGGFTLEAVCAVAGLPQADVLDRVSSLLSKNLLYRPVDIGPARYAMLETTREYAREQLIADGLEHEAAERHARYFVRLAEEVEPLLTKRPGGNAAARLAPETPNLRTALSFALANNTPDLGLKLASFIWRFWQSSEQLTEGREWLERLLEHPDAAVEARAKGLTALAGLAYWQADYDEAIRCYEEALDLFRAAGDRFNEGDCLLNLSLTILWKKDLDAGERLAQQALAIFEELGSREQMGRVLMAQATALYWKHDFTAARELWLEALSISREFEDQALALTQMVGLAGITFHLDEHAEAMEIALDGIGEAIEAGNVHVTVWMLDLVAAIAAAAAPESAVRVAGAADALRERAGGGILSEALEIEDTRVVAARSLDSAVLECAWATGRRLSLEDAVDQARQLGELVADRRAE